MVNSKPSPPSHPNPTSFKHPGRADPTPSVTWNPDFFTTTSSSNPILQIFIQADFTSLNPTDQPGPTPGFTSPGLDPNSGIFSWLILAAYLFPPTANSTTAHLSITLPPPPSTADRTPSRESARFPGPQIHILPSTTSNPNAADSAILPPAPLDSNRARTAGPNPLAIALPIALGLATALLMAAYALAKRYRPGWLPSFLRGSGGSRVKGTTKEGGERGRWFGSKRGGVVRLRGRAVEIQVVKTDLEGLRANAVRAWAGRGGLGSAGGGGGNVFREEVERQERERV